jgi:predicted enzyme related to lactoylglutathione lyase
MPNTIVWVDIPVLDLDRAIGFYSAVLGDKVTKESFAGGSFGLLPHAQQNASGCLVKMEGNKPSQLGPLVYLNVDGRLDAAISAVAANGGKVIEPKHQIGPHGFRAIVVDTEGNRIALHGRAG